MLVPIDDVSVVKLDVLHGVMLRREALVLIAMKEKDLPYLLEHPIVNDLDVQLIEGEAVSRFDHPFDAGVLVNESLRPFLVVAQEVDYLALRPDDRPVPSEDFCIICIILFQPFPFQRPEIPALFCVMAYGVHIQPVP